MVMKKESDERIWMCPRGCISLTKNFNEIFWLLSWLLHSADFELAFGRQPKHFNQHITGLQVLLLVDTWSWFGSAKFQRTDEVILIFAGLLILNTGDISKSPTPSTKLVPLENHLELWDSRKEQICQIQFRTGVASLLATDKLVHAFVASWWTSVAITGV